MDLNRFADLALAYGGDVSRWPATEREAATLLMAASPEATSPLLASQSDLDWALESWRTPRPREALEAAILASAPVQRPARLWRGWLWRTGLGAGLAAAGLAGVVAGVVLSGAVATMGELEVITAAVSAYDTLDLDLSGGV